MDFLAMSYSDIGRTKETNQDAALIKIAQTQQGKAAFAVLCDGMGGLDKGELASATLIRAYSKWFDEELPLLLQQGLTPEALKEQWERIVFSQNRFIMAHGEKMGTRLGTTLTGVLIYNGMSYIINVGDSRTYVIRDQLYQLTKDQTFVEREVTMGRMTPEEAKVDPRRNVLLQCVGASNYVQPDFFMGEVSVGDIFMLCSDGFRHVITPEEIYSKMNASVLHTEEDMKQAAIELVELDKERMESDNITVSLLKLI